MPLELSGQDLVRLFGHYRPIAEAATQYPYYSAVVTTSNPVSLYHLLPERGSSTRETPVTFLDQGSEIIKRRQTKKRKLGLGRLGVLEDQHVYYIQFWYRRIVCVLSIIF